MPLSIRYILDILQEEIIQLEQPTKSLLFQKMQEQKLNAQHQRMLFQKMQEQKLNEQHQRNDNHTYKYYYQIDIYKKYFIL